MSEEAHELANQYGGVWSEHPEHRLIDWQYEAYNNNTRSSYWDWVLNHIELEV